MSAILTVSCNEPSGVVDRSVYPLTLTLETLSKFYNKAKQFKTLFNDDIKDDFKKFLEVFLSTGEDNQITPRGLLWVIDDFVGLYYITDIREYEATVHYTFFDRRQKGRDKLTQYMIKYVFDKYQFHRLNVEVAAYAGKFVDPFVKSLGFKYEGKKRSSIKHKDRWHDMYLYGLIKEDFEEQWDQKFRKSAEALQLA